MKLQRVEVSDNPQLIMECLADLDVNGGREGEVAVKVYNGEDALTVVQEGEQLTITARARCKVACPRGSSLTLRAVRGDLRVRRLDGAIAAEAISGDAVLKEVGPITIANVSGDLRVRSVNGGLELQRVSGDLAARGVTGLLVCESVGGDLSAADLGGGLQAKVGGDGSVKTEWAAGRDYALTTGGDAVLKFPNNASATVQVTAGGKIRHDADWAEVSEGRGTLQGRLSEGEARVSVTAGGDVSLQGRGEPGTFVFGFALEDAELDLELDSMAEEIERNIESHMARLGAQLEAHLGGIDHEAIRHKAERAAEKARRKAEHAAERARLQAERSQRRWERMSPPRAPRPPRPAPGAAQPRPAPSVTDEERMAVLRMVQEGKISASDAARLLEAMEG
jgi:hypothetical protein